MTKGNYKISSQLESAYRAAVPNQFQKDFIEVDRRVNLLYSALEGKILRIFPIPNEPSNKWVSYPELKDKPLKEKIHFMSITYCLCISMPLGWLKTEGTMSNPMVC